MKIVLIGATGATGRALTEQLLNSPSCSTLTILVRKPSFPSHDKLKQVVINFEKLEDFKKDITGDVAISCLGTTLKDAGSTDAQWRVDYDYQLHFSHIARENDIPTFCLVSAMNANSKSRIFYSRMKGMLEDSIKALNFERLLILQPGSLIRPHSDRLSERWIVKILQKMNNWGLLRTFQPLHVDALAQHIIYQLNQSRTGTQVISSAELLSSSNKSNGKTETR